MAEVLRGAQQDFPLPQSLETSFGEIPQDFREKVRAIYQIWYKFESSLKAPEDIQKRQKEFSELSKGIGQEAALFLEERVAVLDGERVSRGRLIQALATEDAQRQKVPRIAPKRPQKPLKTDRKEYIPPPTLSLEQQQRLSLVKRGRPSLPLQLIGHWPKRIAETPRAQKPQPAPRQQNLDAKKISSVVPDLDSNLFRKVREQYPPHHLEGTHFTTDSIWQAVVVNLKTRITKTDFKILQNTLLLSLYGNVAVVLGRSPDDTGILKNRLHGHLNKTLSNLVGRPISCHYIALSEVFK